MLPGCTQKECRRIHQRGFGVLEVLISLALSVVILAATAKIYVAFKKSYRVQQALSYIQESGRHAIQVLVADTRNARYLGQIHAYWNITEAAQPHSIPAISGECFTQATMQYRWINPFTTSIDHDKNSTTPNVFAPQIAGTNDEIGPFAGCIPRSELAARTDVLTIHRVSPKPVLAAELVAHSIYVRSDLNHALEFSCETSGATCLPAGPWDKETDAIYPLTAILYWVRTCTNPGVDKRCGTSDDIDQPNLPALMRTRLRETGKIETDAVSSGVVNFQVEYGVDDDDVGYPQVYLSANAVGALNDSSSWNRWQHVRTVRFSVIVRSDVREAEYQGPNSFQIGDHVGDAAIDVTANYRHLLFTNTVSLRNFTG